MNIDEYNLIFKVKNVIEGVAANCSSNILEGLIRFGNSYMDFFCNFQSLSTSCNSTRLCESTNIHESVKSTTKKNIDVVSLQLFSPVHDYWVR